MAKQIKVLKCPQCGNPKPENIGNEHYRCGKCGTEFFLDNDDVNINVNHRYDGGRPGNYRAKPMKKGAVWTIVALILLSAFIIIANLFNRPSTPVRPLTATSRPVSGSRNLLTTLFSVEGQAVVLEIDKRRNADSLRVVFRNIEKGNILKKQSIMIGDAGTDVGYRWFPSENTHYLTIGKNMLYKIDLSTYNLENITAGLSARKPALEAGIMKIEFVPPGQGEGFKLHTNLGKDLYYFPAPDVLCTEQAFRYMKANKPVPDARPEIYYLFLNKESSHSSNVAQLLRIEYLYNAGGPENKMLEATENRLKNKDEYRIRSFKPITGDRVFFSPRILYYDEENILIAYEPTLAQGSVSHTQLIDTKGETIWDISMFEKIDIVATVKTEKGFMLQTKANKFIQIYNTKKSYTEYELPKL